ncbi:MAG TPA: hypothetical protein VIY49_23910 [Bryobacteraceae bacterium]
MEGIYGCLLEPGAFEAAKPPNADLESLLANVLDADARNIATAADAAKAAMPQVGFEIADGRGEIVAAAELAWPDQRVCVLTKAQSEYADAARAAGWTVWLAAELAASPWMLIDHLPRRTA